MVDLKALVPWRNRSETPARRGDVFDPFVDFRREVDRVFDDFANGIAWSPLRPFAGDWRALAPALDVTETDEEVVVSAELPGLDEKDFEVTLAGDVLTIKGEKKAEHEEKNGDAHYMERCFGSFSRSLRLPFEAKDEKVEAKYDKGVLTVRIPKPPEVQSAVRRIEVKAA
jgi:HSP20 family protein